MRRLVVGTADVTLEAIRRLHRFLVHHGREILLFGLSYLGDILINLHDAFSNGFQLEVTPRFRLVLLAFAASRLLALSPCIFLSGPLR